MTRCLVVFFTILVAFAPTSQVFADSAKQEAIKEPVVNAMGAILMDSWTGRVLWGKNEREPMAMASTTKIMTAIIALESDMLEDICLASKRAAYTPKVKMGLSTGEKIKMNDLVYALMLESQNDAAVAIAEHIAGSEESFCEMMTEKAREIGALDTIYETSNGLDKGDHHSTAYDLALIARYALSNPEFVKLINTKNKSFSSDRRPYSFINKNRLLYEYDGANGIKTGFTNKAGHCFVGSAKRGDMGLISVVLASGWGSTGKQAKWTDTKAILNYGFANYSYYRIVEAGSDAGNVNVGRSRTDEISCVFAEELTLPLRSDEISSLEIAQHLPAQVLAPVDSGEVLGVADVLVKGQLLTQIPLVAESSASRHDFKTSLEKVINCAVRFSTQADIKVVLPEFALPEF